MYSKGMLASEFIVLLQSFIDKFGDLPLYSGGGDYPEGVTGIWIEREGDGCVPKDSFKI